MNKWDNFHVVDTKDVTDFKLVGWDDPSPTIRKLMKRLRAQWPDKEWRVEPSSAYGSIKWIQCRVCVGKQVLAAILIGHYGEEE